MNTRQFFFIHVMKTAGTTFVRQLQQEFPPESIYPARTIDWTSEHDYDAYINIPRLLALTPARRAEIRVFTGHFPYMACELVAPGCTTLSVLREPVAGMLKGTVQVGERYVDGSRANTRVNRRRSAAGTRRRRRLSFSASGTAALTRTR